MTEETKNTTGSDTRLDWVEPEVRELSVTETAVHPGHGPDGETIWTDCTAS
jgi:hypothetical protein